MGTPILMKKSRGEKTRTSDLHVPNVARCQLCYTPSWLLLSEKRCKDSKYFATTGKNAEKNLN